MPVVNEHPQTGPDVTIVIDNKTFTVHRGNVTVAELKALAGVPVAYELEEIVDGTLSRSATTVVSPLKVVSGLSATRGQGLRRNNG